MCEHFPVESKGLLQALCSPSLTGSFRKTDNRLRVGQWMLSGIAMSAESFYGLNNGHKKLHIAGLNGEYASRQRGQVT